MERAGEGVRKRERERKLIRKIRGWEWGGGDDDLIFLSRNPY
jgi:hypothetical protein